MSVTDMNTQRSTADKLKNWHEGMMAYKLLLPEGQEYEFELITRLVVNKNNNFRVLDSISRHNLGYNKLPSRFTFTLVIPVNTEGANLLRGLLAAEKIFDLEYFNLHYTEVNNEYKLIREKLVNCILESSANTYQIEGVSMITFTGKALGYKFAGQISEPATYFNKIFGDNNEAIDNDDLSSMIDTNVWPGT